MLSTMHLKKLPYIVKMQHCFFISVFNVLSIYTYSFFSSQQVKTIFLFLINQLQGLRDPKDPAFKRYFYLLENLAYVKSFNMCFELEDCQEIFCALFSLMFKIVK